MVGAIIYTVYFMFMMKYLVNKLNKNHPQNLSSSTFSVSSLARCPVRWQLWNRTFDLIVSDKAKSSLICVHFNIAYRIYQHHSVLPKTVMFHSFCNFVSIRLNDNIKQSQTPSLELTLCQPPRLTVNNTILFLFFFHFYSFITVFHEKKKIYRSFYEQCSV